MFISLALLKVHVTNYLFAFWRLVLELRTFVRVIALGFRKSIYTRRPQGFALLGDGAVVCKFQTLSWLKNSSICCKFSKKKPCFGVKQVQFRLILSNFLSSRNFSVITLLSFVYFLFMTAMFILFLHFYNIKHLIQMASWSIWKYV